MKGIPEVRLLLLPNFGRGWAAAPVSWLAGRGIVVWVALTLIFFAPLLDVYSPGDHPVLIF